MCSSAGVAYIRGEVSRPLVKGLAVLLCLVALHPCTFTTLSCMGVPADQPSTCDCDSQLVLYS